MRLVIEHLLKLSSGHEEDPTNKRLVVVERMKFRRRHMQGASLRKTVLQLVVQREEVNVVHSNVVTLLTAQEKTNIQQRSTIKPINRGCIYKVCKNC